MEYSKWSKDLNVPDPVAISFDAAGTAYVTQTTRRKANDLDIRNNRDWTVQDVGMMSVQQKLDFYRSRLAPERSDQNRRRVQDLNGDGRHDFRDLTMLSEKIHRVRDTDGDGFADRIDLFAGNFQTEVTGIAAGVLHFRDAENQPSVFATIAPDLWRLRDTNGDGKADQREKIATGFGMHIAYAGHDMHGLTVGPDGKIYWSIGDKGIHVQSKEGPFFVYPNQGGVMRCNPDGSDFEVFAHGLRNVQELAFDQYGNLFGVDNDADQPGERERFVYIVQDMDAGWRCNYQYRGGDFNPWTDEKLWQTWHTAQPAYVTPPLEYSINGPCGFAFNPGTALSESYRNYFFLTGAPHGEQIAFRVRQNGASFRMEDVHPVGRGTALIGINFGPDGGLYGVDWANGYPLNRKGAVWKLDVGSGRQHPLRPITQQLLKKNLQPESADKLVDYLAHADQRVRLRAQFELVRRKDLATLGRVVGDVRASQLARIHALWGAGQLESQAGGGPDWAAVLSDEDPEIVVQALKVIRNLESFPSPAFHPLVDSKNPRVLFHLLMALSKHGDPSWLPTVAFMARDCKPGDVYLRHATIRALAGCDLEKDLGMFVVHRNPLVRLWSVVALRQLGSEKIVEFLQDSDRGIRTEAARGIHDDFSIDGAMPGLAQQLDSTNDQDANFMVRALNANFRLGGEACLYRILKWIGDPSGKEELRLLAMRMIREWEAPHPLDKVTGRFRDFAKRQLTESDRMRIQSTLRGLLGSENSTIQASAIRSLRDLKIQLDDRDLLQIVNSKSASESLLMESLGKLAKQKSEKLGQAIELLLRHPSGGVRVFALEQLAEDSKDQASRQLETVFRGLKTHRARQQAIRLAGRLKTGDSTTLLETEFAGYLEEGRNRDIALELSEAVRAIESLSNPAARLIERQKKKWSMQKDAFSLARFEVCLEGGDSQRGKRLFETGIDTQCTRCHRVGRNGSTVGPKLDGIGKKRKPEALLRSIVHPSAEIEKPYRTLLIGLVNGQTLSGLKIRETDDRLTLADAGGKTIQVSRADIEELVLNRKSIMPEMAESLTLEKLRDLVAYLKSLQ
ncbi:MAG: PVC-type heme-binding CxxCH protein [Planctomycetota bacterium]|nr:PVC-type heme-binding CxxCH protein [Planctomycetota bacterium]